MSIVNLERDMRWSPDLSPVTPILAAFGSSPFNVGTNSVVGQRVNGFATNFATSGTSNSIWSAGCILLPPADGDVTPYRFLASVTGSLQTAFFAYGWFDSGAVVGRRIIGCGRSIDRVIALPPLDSADPSYGRPVCFMACALDNATGLVMLEGSAQRMIAKPPQFASAVS